MPAGEIGQIFVRSGTLFDGYTSGTTKDFHDGFMASGDMGYLDDAGRLFVVGRDDEMIVSGGENVYPIEVEKALVAHPEVAEAAVLGVDDEQYGQRLVAFVVLEAGASATPDALKQHVRDNLANYKVPREITVLDELPRGSTGKILRNELRGRCLAGRGRRRHRRVDGAQRRQSGGRTDFGQAVDHRVGRLVDVFEGLVVGQYRDVHLVDVAPDGHVEGAAR